MRLIISSLEEVESGIIPETDSSQSQDISMEVQEHPLFISNESVTMAKLHSLMGNNNGVYLNIIDEVGILMVWALHCTLLGYNTYVSSYSSGSPIFLHTLT